MSTPWRADPRFAGDGYVLLDSQRVEPDDLRRDNAAAMLAGLENPSPSTLPELVGAVCRRLRAPELRELKEVMLAWAGWRARQAGLRIEVEDMAEVLNGEPRRRRGRSTGRGRKFGRRSVVPRVVPKATSWGNGSPMRRHAAMKFDAQTAPDSGQCSKASPIRRRSTACWRR